MSLGLSSRSTDLPPLGVRRGLRLLAVMITACALSACASGDDADTVVSLAPRTVDAAKVRDRDVAWIYHLAKSRHTDDLVARLDRERLDDVRQGLDVGSDDPFSTSAPHPAAPAAVVARGIETIAPLVHGTSAPSPVPTGAATEPADPLAALPHTLLDPALTLGLFSIDPVTYRRLFVDDYPVTADPVDDDYGGRLARSGLGGGVAFPIRSLASIARGGDDVAYAKLLEASAVAKGSVADLYAVEIARIAQAGPARFWSLLGRLPMGTRLAVVSFQGGWCRMPPRSLLRDVPDDAAQLALQRDLRATAEDCARDRRAEHRHRRSGKRAKRSGPHRARGSHGAKRPLHRRA